MVCCWRALGLSSSQIWMEHSGHEDLRGLGRQSVTPYVHGEDCCIALCMALFKAELNLFQFVFCLVLL
jgi:hypothetical protein